MRLVAACVLRCNNVLEPKSVVPKGRVEFVPVSVGHTANRHGNLGEDLSRLLEERRPTPVVLQRLHVRDRIGQAGQWPDRRDQTIAFTLKERAKAIVIAALDGCEELLAPHDGQSRGADVERVFID